MRNILRASHILFLAILLPSSSALAKSGTSLCTLGDCDLKDLPIGIPEKKAAHKRTLETKTPGTPKTVSKTSKKAPERSLRVAPSNLPKYYSARSNFKNSSEDNVYNVPRKKGEPLRNVKPGDMLYALVEQSIKASPSVPTPIRAVIMKGPYRGAFLLGEATLDKELKRVLIGFTRLRLVAEDKVFELRATGHSSSGQIGIEGEYESHSGKFFVGEMLSATAAGVVDATTQRTQNSFGNYVQEPTLTNAAKQGTVQALSRSADRMADAARLAPEFTETKPFQKIRVMIQETPTELGA